MNDAQIPGGNVLRQFLHRLCFPGGIVSYRRSSLSKQWVSALLHGVPPFMHPSQARANFITQETYLPQKFIHLENIDWLFNTVLLSNMRQ